MVDMVLQVVNKSQRQITYYDSLLEDSVVGYTCCSHLKTVG
jgi:hypothetical protein